MTNKPTGAMNKDKWKTLLNLIVTILTAIAATLTTQSCMGV